MELFLTAKQKSNLMKKPIQISQKQLMGGTLNATHQMRINLNDNGKKKVQKAMRQQKGFRLQPSKDYEGGSLLGKLGKAGLKLASNEQFQDFVIDKGMNAYNNYMSGQGFLKSVKNTAKKAGKTIKKASYDVKLGKTLESVKDAIPQELVESSIKGALMAQGVSPEQADAIAAAGTSTVYGYSFDEKPTKKNFSSAIQDGVQAGLESGITSAMSGNGIFQKNSLYKKKGSGFKGSGVGSGFKGSGRPQKGSQQARDKMAMIRAMKKSGGSFRDY